jgi:outer membrane protein assembly factor BamB
MMKNAGRILIWCLCVFSGCVIDDTETRRKGYENETVHMYRGGIAHTGNYLSERPIRRDMELLWQYEGLNRGIHTASKSSPVVDDRMIFVGSDSGYLYAFDKNRGTVEWRFKVRWCRNGIHGTPAVDHQKVYIGAYDGYLYALEKRTGAMIWEVRLGDYIGSSPTLFEDRVYIGVETRRPGGHLVAVERETGTVIFKTRDLDGHTHCTPTIDEKLRKVYLGANSRIFFAFNADTGRLHWKLPTGGAIKSTAALSRRYVLFTSWDSYVYVMLKKADRVKWKFKTRKRSMSSPALDEEDNRVYVGSHDRTCYALALDSGKEIWRKTVRGRIISSPVIARLDEGDAKVILIGSNDGGLYMLDAVNGRQINCFQLDSRVTSVPVVRDGRVYISSNSDLYVFQ